MDSRESGSLPRGAGVGSPGSEIEPSAPKEDPAPSEQRRAANLGSSALGGYKQLVEYLRIVAMIVEGICDENDLPGVQFTETVVGFLDATGELLNKAL